MPRASIEPPADHGPTGASVTIPEAMVFPKLGYSELMTGKSSCRSPSLSILGGLMWPRVGTRSHKPQRRWIGTASNPLARFVGTNWPIVDKPNHRSAASPQPRRRDQELQNCAPQGPVVVSDCWSRAASYSEGSCVPLVDVVDDVESRLVDVLACSRRPETQGSGRASHTNGRSRHRSPLLAPSPQRQAPFV